MGTEILTGDDVRFLAQQPESEVGIMLGQMTTLMQNINDLQTDTDDKVAKLESQNWFKRMTNTLFGRNKATKQEIQKNNDKVVTYISQSVAQLYQMNMINERIICSLGNRMNEVYMQVTSMYQEQLNMKAQISQIMAVQQQTLEAMGAFVSKLNEKIESVDNFHMLISEIQNGMYNDSSKLYNLCCILSQLDKRQMDDGRKMHLLRDTMERSAIITQDEFTVLQCLQEIVALPTEKIGLIYMELCNFRQSFPANLFADMIESYHFLSKMEKMSKKKDVIIQRLLDNYELDSDAAFSIADIANSFFENKQASLVNVGNIQITINNEPAVVNQTSVGDSDKELFAKIDKYFADLLKSMTSDNPDCDDVDFDFSENESNRIDELAELGEPHALTLYAFAKGDEEDPDIEILIECAEKNYVMAQLWAFITCFSDDAYAEYRNRTSDFIQAAVNNGIEKYVSSDVWAMINELMEEVTGTDSVINDEEHTDVKLSNNDIASCLWIANTYFIGNGVEQDYVKAVEWYTKAAEQGNADAQNMLGYCYSLGNGVAINLYKAYEWVKKAAEQGHADAQYNLGDCYYNGKGVTQNYNEAVKWYRNAAEQGHEDAINRLRELNVL